MCSYAQSLVKSFGEEKVVKALVHDTVSSLNTRGRCEYMRLFLQRAMEGNNYIAL